jgi:cephalosporin hydroxylase
MLKTIVFLLLCISTLCGETVEEMKKTVCHAMMGIHGWATKEKGTEFIDLVLQVKPDICVEIGVFGGRSILPVAAALKHLKKGIVVGIDPWDRNEILPYFDPIEDQPHIEWWSKINLEAIYYSYLNLLSQFELQNYVVTLKTTSALASFAIESIDILYIDGNHNEKTSLMDVMLYLPKVRPGGYIWFNDSLWADLQSSVDFLAQECDFVKLIDDGNCILFRKPCET